MKKVIHHVILFSLYSILSLAISFMFCKDDNPTEPQYDSSLVGSWKVSSMSWDGATESRVKLQIFNTLSELITTLVDETKNAGVHQLEWNASNLASGVYLYKINAELVGDAKQFNEVKKLILLK